MSAPLSAAVSGLDWMRLTTIPRLTGATDPGRWLTSSIHAAIVSAHAELLLAATAPPAADRLGLRPGPGPGLRPAGPPGGTPAFAVAWIRPPSSQPVHFLIGGRPALPMARSSRSGVSEAVLFPPGATGERLDSRLTGSWFEFLPAWLRCLGTMDVDLGDATAAARARLQSSDDAPAGLDDYAIHLRSPFAWLMVAEPAGWDDLDDEIASLGARLAVIGKRESSQTHQLDLERGQRRLRELTRARSSGLWRVHLLAGGMNDVRVRQAASLLCSATDVTTAGALLLPAEKPMSLPAAWASPADGPDRSSSPFLAGPGLVAALARPPMRELPGIRLLEPYRFDVTPVPADPAGAIELGNVLDESLHPAGTFRVPYDTLNRHGFICGATGSGKSQTARRLLESLSTGPRRIPWLVVEPAKAEYARMSGRLAGTGDVLVIRPGELDAPPASFNPLEPELGFSLQSHADLVRALFLAAFEANEPFPQVLSHALTECYTAAGWNLVTGRPHRQMKPKFRIDEPSIPQVPRYPGLAELQATARTVVDNIGYGSQVAADVRGFVDVRMGSLRQGAPGRFFEGGHPLDLAQLLEQNVVLELESITNDQDKAFLIGTVLIRLVEHLRVRQRTGASQPGLRHVLLIEEAHRLLKNVHQGPAAAAVELFAELLAEIRAYGEGVVIVEQIPSKILPDVIKNTALKVMHRLPAQDDRDAVGATMNLSEAGSQAVVSFPPGIAAVTVDGDDRPLLIGVTGGMDREDAAEARLDPPLRGRRSPLCGAECLSSACTLAQLDAAATTASEPALLIWSEAVAATMVLGRPAPVLRAHVRSDMTRRHADCVVATLASRAAATRRPWLTPWIDPDDFTARMATVLNALLAGRAEPPGDPIQWRTGAFRWQDVYIDLRMAITAAGTSAPTAPPHLETQDWHERGLILDAPTLAAQFDQLTNDPAYAFGTEKAVFGDPGVSGLRQALKALSGNDTEAGLTRALRHIIEPVAGDDLPTRLAQHL